MSWGKREDLSWKGFEPSTLRVVIRTIAPCPKVINHQALTCTALPKPDCDFFCFLFFIFFLMTILCQIRRTLYHWASKTILVWYNLLYISFKLKLHLWLAASQTWQLKKDNGEGKYKGQNAICSKTSGKNICNPMITLYLYTHADVLH